MVGSRNVWRRWDEPAAGRPADGAGVRPYPVFSGRFAPENGDGHRTVRERRAGVPKGLDQCRGVEFVTYYVTNMVFMLINKWLGNSLWAVGGAGAGGEAGSMGGFLLAELSGLGGNRVR